MNRVPVKREPSRHVPAALPAPLPQRGEAAAVPNDAPLQPPPGLGAAFRSRPGPARLGPERISGGTPEVKRLQRFHPVAFLPKPFAMDELRTVVAKQLPVPQSIL